MVKWLTRESLHYMEKVTYVLRVSIHLEEDPSQDKIIRETSKNVITV